MPKKIAPQHEFTRSYAFEQVDALVDGTKVDVERPGQPLLAHAPVNGTANHVVLGDGGQPIDVVVVADSLVILGEQAGADRWPAPARSASWPRAARCPAHRPADSDRQAPLHDVRANAAQPKVLQLPGGQAHAISDLGRTERGGRY
jgi:hypothetical protein